MIKINNIRLEEGNLTADRATLKAMKFVYSYFIRRSYRVWRGKDRIVTDKVFENMKNMIKEMEEVCSQEEEK